ncbi:DUF3043 domain-containing protein [Streptomyces sp. NPDC001380]|uniref:DUF3043 domain-containing protein n=1 Tax=Streptomyces sp. NPDC001380 TaxID=3364566 RepID=UPI0036A93423
MFRRRSQDAPAAATALADEQAAQPRNPQAPKGRPTPKRSEAQASRRTRTSVPKDRKEAARDARTRMRAEREKQRLALLNGDERALPARDKGPVRRFARDFVDSRFTVAEWFLPFAVVILILSVLRNPALQFVSLLMWLVVIVGIVVDSVRHAVVLRKQLRQRFPNESHKGVTAYALMRTLQMRRLRLPKPQVKRGAKL